MTKKQKKMLTRIIASAILVFVAIFIPTSGKFAC